MKRCGHPDKQPYTSRRAAKRAIRALYNQRRDQGGRLVAYPCSGGHWHIGHNNTIRRKVGDWSRR